MSASPLDVAVHGYSTARASAQLLLEVPEPRDRAEPQRLVDADHVRVDLGVVGRQPRDVGPLALQQPQVGDLDRDARAGGRGARGGRACPTGRRGRARGPSSRGRSRRPPRRPAESATVLYFVRPCRANVASRSRTASVLTASGSSSRSPVGASVVSVEVSRPSPCSRSSGTGPDPRAQRVRRVGERGLVRQPCQHGVVDRQRELALHLRQRQVEAAARARTADPARPAPSGPASHVQPTSPVRTVRPRAPRLRPRRGRAAPCRSRAAGGRGATWTSSSASSRLSSSGVRIQPAPDGLAVHDGRPAARPRRRAGVAASTARSSSSCHGVAAAPMRVPGRGGRRGATPSKAASSNGSRSTISSRGGAHRARATRPSSHTGPSDS